MNETNVADYLTGLVILTHSLPATITDANGDNLADCFEQSMHDLADELGVSALVDFNAAGEPADAVMVDRNVARAIVNLTATLDLAVNDLPQTELDLVVNDLPQIEGDSDD